MKTLRYPPALAVLKKECLQVPSNAVKPEPASNSGETETTNLWEDLEEPPIEVDEFSLLFGVTIADKPLGKKAAGEPKAPASASVLDAKRSQNVWIMVKNLKSNNLDLERLENAIYNVDLTDLNYERMHQIKDLMVSLLI